MKLKATVPKKKLIRRMILIASKKNQKKPDNVQETSKRLLMTLRSKIKRPLLKLVIPSQNTKNIRRNKYKVSKKLSSGMKSMKII